MKLKDIRYFMSGAIKEAYKGIQNKDGGPFGCVIVKEDEKTGLFYVIGKGHNEVIKNNDCTCHGEMMAIRDACKNLNTFDLSNCVLFTTSAPCPMCSGAIQWARIKDVYEACNYDDAADIGFDDKEFFENPLITETVEREEGLKLFEDYKNMEHKLY